MGTHQDKAIGASVARLRVELGLSQQALAEGLREANAEHRWSQATVWSVEKGDRSLKAAEVHDLSELLGVDPTIFIFPDEGGAAILQMQRYEAAIRGSIIALLADVERAGSWVTQVRPLIAEHTKDRSQFDPRAWERLEPIMRKTETLASLVDLLDKASGAALRKMSASLKEQKVDG